MPNFYSEHNLRRHFNAPQFTRSRHRFRGPRESEKINLEMDQLHYSIHKLYQGQDEFQEHFVDRANLLLEGGDTTLLDNTELLLNSHALVSDVNLLDTIQSSFDNVPFNETVSPEDRYKVWGSGGGTGAGAPGETSPMLIDLDKYKTDRYLHLPGKSGNYASIPDVNKLGAGISLPRGEISSISRYVTPPLPGVDVSHSYIEDSDFFGGYAVKVMTDAPGSPSSVGLRFQNIQGYGSGSFTGKTITVLVAIKLHQYIGNEFRFLLRDNPNNDTFASSIAGETMVIGEKRYIRAEFTVPPDREATDIYVTISGSVNFDEGDLLTAGELAVYEGSWPDAPFIPSTRITGDLDLRARFSLDSVSVSDPGNRGIITKWPDSYRWLLLGNGSFYFDVRSDGSQTDSLTYDAGLIASEVETFRVTREASSGEVKVYKLVEGSWDELTAASRTAGPADASSTPLRIGRSASTEDVLNGQIFWMDVRDGIDGPSVASYDFDDAPSRAATTLTTPEAHQLTIHQNNVLGAGQAELRGGRPEKVAWLPGATNNYFHIDDVNILSAWAAQLTQPDIKSTSHPDGDRTREWLIQQAHGSTLEEDPSLPWGEKYIHLIRTNDDSWQPDWGVLHRVVVSAGQELTFSAEVRGSSAGRVSFAWRDSSDNLIGWDYGAEMVSAAEMSDTNFQRGGATRTAPSGAVACVVVVTMVDNPDPGDSFLDFHSPCLKVNDDDISFIPSHRIVADLDIRARYAEKARGQNQQLILKDRSDNYSYQLRILTNGAIQFVWSPDGTSGSVIAHQTGIAWQDRTHREVRVTFVADNGSDDYEVKFFHKVDNDWEQLGSTQTGAASQIFPGDSPIDIGSRAGSSSFYRGVMLEAEIRDGINGPIVARFDADDPAGFAAGANNLDSYVDETSGHSVVLRQNSHTTTEVVNGNTWAFADDSWMDIPTNELLDHGINDFEIAALTATRTRTWALIASKKYNTATNHPGWMYGFSVAGSGGFVTRVADEEENQRAMLLSNYDDGVWRTYGFSHTQAQLVKYVDGVQVGDTSTPLVGNTDTDVSLRIGRSGEGSTLYKGLISWIAIFRRTLTESERVTLANWDGTVATEPQWLRPLAVLYINADDTLVRESYENNEILNLATAPYGELGWSLTKTDGDNNPYMDRWNELTPTFGHMSLRVHHGDDGGTSSWKITSSEVYDVEEGQTYTGSISSIVPTATGLGAVCSLVWVDGVGGEIGRTEGDFQKGPQNEWFRHHVTGEAPVGAKGARLVVDNQELRGVPIFVDAVTIRQGASTDFIPSLRIRNDISVEVLFSKSDWTIPANQTVVATNDSADSFGWDFRFNPDHTTSFRIVEDGVVNSVQSAVILDDLDIDTLYRLKVNAVSTGDVHIYINDSLVSRLNIGPFTIDASLMGLAIGSLIGGNDSFKGSMRRIALRDGVEGPILLYADFDGGNYQPETGQSIELMGEASLNTLAEHSSLLGLEELVSRIDQIIRRVKALEA